MKSTIIVVENREPYYFIIIYKCKEVPLCLFSYWTITKAAWYVTNWQLRTNLNLNTVSEVIARQANHYIRHLHEHPNDEAVLLLDDSNDTRRLQRLHSLDLINNLIITVDILYFTFVSDCAHTKFM